MSSRPVLDFDRGTIVLSHEEVTLRDSMPRLRSWAWDARVGSWRADARRYADALEELRARGTTVDDRVPKWSGIHWPRCRLADLRSEQQTALDAWMTTRRGCLVLPTGTGKTEIAIAGMAAVAMSTLVVVPIRDLMYQWRRRIQESLGYDAGLIGDSHFSARPVSITTYDSACLHMEQLGDRFSLVVFDECHHLPGPIRQDAARMCAAPWRLGLSATLERSDGRHLLLDELIGPVVYRLSMDSVRGTTLADYDIERIEVHLSPEEQRHYDRLSAHIRSYLGHRRRQDPTYDWKRLCSESATSAAAMQVLRDYQARQSIEHRAAEKLRILEDLFRLHHGEPMIVFAGSNLMARDISRRFLIPCLLSETSRPERAEILTGFAEGRYPAVVANRVLDEGVDVPDVKVAVVVGGTASQRQAQQRLGRVLRRSGNTPARLYEIVCVETRELRRFHQRRKCDAYQAARNRHG